MPKKYVIGIDYGTESGRALLVDVKSGEEVAVHITAYPHGVIDEYLPGSEKPLGRDWALQNPDDYMEVLRRSVPAVLAQKGVHPGDVIGIGIDFTACTILPIDRNGVPLCMNPEWRDEPHCWVKLWKHHAAQEEADRFNEAVQNRGSSLLQRYGGKISSEWMIPKIWQILNENESVYHEADRFVEAVDWIVYQLTGNLHRNSCAAGYKANWHKQDGYPDSRFLTELDARLESLSSTKLRGDVLPIGSKAGELTPQMASLTGLLPGTAVAVGIIDAHAGVLGTGVVSSGKMVMAMGTSVCHMLLDDKERHIEGVCGVVEDGIVPGYFAYEAGQAAVGDIFSWFVEQAVPEYVHRQASSEGRSVFQWLEGQASRYQPGETGLIALDWWNGNRSVLADASLSGLILGLSLQTKPEAIYRALLEATAFGTRRIIEAFEAGGIQVYELYACGGLAQKNRLLMQIFADVTGRELKVAASSQTPALGAAILASVAAGSTRGGFDHFEDAARHMARVQEETFRPNPDYANTYWELYEEYCKLYDYFGRGGNDIMKKLKKYGVRD